ncbi:hypothetical protein PO909_011311 [Leuciscus waleckii]
MARSRVAPKRQQSIPRLELCAALAGAQLAKLVRNELTLSISQTILWTDSMTVLEWIQSDSCRYKVFVGTRVTEMQELTDHSSWRYVNTQDNPADDITRGKTLQSLAEPSRWSQGPPFLKQSPEHWPKRPEVAQSEVVSELKGLTCYSVMAVETESNLPDVTQFKTWRELVGATLRACQGAAASNSVIMKFKISSMSDMCCDVIVHLHRNYPNNLSKKLFKGTLQRCGGNYGNTVGQLHFVYKITLIVV